MAKLSKEMIQVGQIIYVVGHDCQQNYKEAPVAFQITGEVIDKHKNYDCFWFPIKFVNSKDKGRFFGFIDAEGKLGVFVGDKGVIGYEYDNRVCQVFTTIDEAWEAIAMWAGRNPNFIDKDTGEYSKPVPDYWVEDNYV